MQLSARPFIKLRFYEGIRENAWNEYNNAYRPGDLDDCNVAIFINFSTVCSTV